MIEVDFKTITFDLLEIKQVMVIYFDSVVEWFYVNLSCQISTGKQLIEICSGIAIVVDPKMAPIRVS